MGSREKKYIDRIPISYIFLFFCPSCTVWNKKYSIKPIIVLLVHGEWVQYLKKKTWIIFKFLLFSKFTYCLIRNIHKLFGQSKIVHLLPDLDRIQTKNTFLKPNGTKMTHILHHSCIWSNNDFWQMNFQLIRFYPKMKNYEITPLDRYLIDQIVIPYKFLSHHIATGQNFSCL